MKTNILKKVVALGLAASMVIPAATVYADNDSDGKKVELLLYHRMGEMTDWFTDFCDYINEKYPNIHIEQETQKDESTLQVKYAAGDDPEILVGPATQQYIDMGKYNSFDNFPELMEKIKPAAKNPVTNVADGKVYRMPLCENTFGLFYNAKMFEELGLSEPKTWDEFVTVLETVKEAKPDVIPLYCFGGNYGHQIMYWAFGPLEWDYGAQGVLEAIAENDSDVLQFDKEGSYIEQYASRLLELQEKGLFDNDIAITGTPDTAAEAFAAEKTAIVMSGTWWFGSLIHNYPDSADFVSIAPLPSIVDGVENPYTSAGADSCVSYTSNPEKQEEIAIVLNELFSDEFLKSYSEHRGAPSAYEGVESDWGMIADKVAENWEKYPASVFQPEPTAGFGLGDFDKFGQELVVGTYTPQEFAQEFASRWNACF